MNASRVIKRSLLGLGLFVAVLAIVAVGLTLWIFNTQSGTRWALNRASAFTDGALQVSQVDGTLAGPLRLNQLRYRDAAGSIDLTIERVLLELDASQLLHAAFHIQNLEISGVRTRLGPPAQKEPAEPSEPFSLDPPLDIGLERVQVAGVVVERDQATLLAIDTAQLIGAWTGAGGVMVKQLDVRSPQGQIHFAGNVRGQEQYEGHGEGRVKWTVGERTYAASMTSDAAKGRVDADVHITSPLTARLTLKAEQTKVMPWSFTLDAPSFDPRKNLMPDSSLNNLAAALRGSGDSSHANVSGTLTINDEPVQIEHLNVARDEQAVRLDGRIRPSRGEVDLDGLVRLAQTPATAQMQVQWRDVVIPESLAGQVLHTQGDVHIDGSAEDYSARGALQLGPPDRLADIRVDIKGSPERIEIAQLAIHQPKGELTASGRVDLQPAIAWDAKAKASHFNPGEFAVAWKGDLNFNLASTGLIMDAGPTAELNIDQLSGRLRGRAIEGRGDLRLTDDKVLSGNLLLRSGSSEIRVDGDHGDAMNANVVLQIPALNDWLPDASGELYGRVLAQGRWPELNVDANVRGSSLRYATNHAEALTVNANVSRLQDPRGTLSVRGSKLTLGGLAFDTMNMQAQGEMSNHTFELNANGQPLTTHVRLHGGKTGTAENVGWSGNLDELMLDVQNVARMALQQPVKIDYADQGVHVSQACLAGSDIHLCASGDTEKSGALRADYSLRNVPLALANTFSGSSASFDLSGTIDGEGRVQRDAQGHLQGQITVTSSRGAIARHAEPPLEATETLLSYADLRLVAQLDGSNGNGTLSARLNDTGGLKGDVQLMGLGEVATQVRGRVNADLPSISVIEAFAPQLANVQGKLRVNLGVAGTIDEPQIDGTIAAEDLAADIPTVGLKLRKGQFTVEPRSASEFALNGRVSSGDGNLQFAGLATTQGRVQMNVSGKRFVAADIPGAHVEIDPTLTFSRSEDRMSLEGDLLIPAARIDMQKLPRTTSTQQASPDVIVIDEKTQEEAQAERIPLYASIRVSLGEKVELVGFGLDSKVAGELVVRESPGSPTTGSGEVRVSGTYKAYGQDLTIRQGQLLFAGTPLDNPNLSIVAIRQVESVVAGLRIQGSARNPQLTVFSEPPMAQSNALAYLVTGKPLNEIGSGTGEGDAMQTAARSLGTAAGGLLAKNLGKRLGVDEVGVKDSEAIGGAALTVGQYLSPRLYLSYGVGLFEPGEVVTLRYKLSEAFTIEALNGPRDSRAGVEYRIER